MARQHSFKRISGWSFFLGTALVLALCLWYLPRLLSLDQFRPDFIHLLEKTFHARAEIGHVRAELIPSPGLYVNRMVLISETQPPEVLAAGSLHVALAWRSLLLGRLEFTSLRFSRPRFIAHRHPDARGQVDWVILEMAPVRPSDNHASVDAIEIRGGSLEVWDHATRPATRWVVDDLTGQFQPNLHQGAVTGRAQFLGRQNLLDLHYQGQDPDPLLLHLSNISLTALQSVLHVQIPALEGTAEAAARIRIRPVVEIRMDISRLSLKRLPDTRFKGTVFWHQPRLQGQLTTGTTSPMTLGLSVTFPGQGWIAQGSLQGYNAAVIHKLYDQYWVNRLDGPGTLTFSMRTQPVWSWAVEGHGFRFTDTAFRIPQWSGLGDSRTNVIDVRVTTPQGGLGEVVWEKPRASPNAILTVDVASVTIRQVLEVFHLQGSRGFETWSLTKADMEAVLHPNQFEVQDSDIDTLGAHIDLQGTFGLSGSSEPAHIHGDVLNVPLEPVVASFTGPPSPITGTAQTEFDLAFPLSALWLRELSGDIQLTAINGLVRSFKTFYRVMSVLNLTNYVRLRMPQVTAEGIPFLSLNGHLQFLRGLMTTDNLFLKSPSLNIGAKGAADLREQRIDVVLRVELFQFLEEALKSVPITHWIFKKPTKIFLPLVVKVKGPWDNPDVH